MQTVDEYYAFDVYVLVGKPFANTKLSSKNKGMYHSRKDKLAFGYK